MSLCKSKSFSLGILVFMAATCLPTVAQAQSSRGQELMEEHRNRVNKMRQEQQDRFDEIRQKNQDRFEEMRSKSGSEIFEDMRRESDERMTDAREHQEELFREMENRGTSSSRSNSSSGVRVSGRAIRGIIFLVVAIGGGVMKLFGFAGGNRGG